MFSENKNQTHKTAFTLSYDKYDVDDLIDEARDIVKGSMPDITDGILSSKLISNAQEFNKISFVYLTDDAHHSPSAMLHYKAISSHPEFDSKFEFMALPNPSDQTRHTF